MHNVTQPTVPWPTGDGEMARRIREHHWAATPLGPPEGWPQSLKTATDIMLASPGPVSILWGPDRVQLYNDAYVPIAAERHPAVLGRPAAENWSEAHEAFLGPIFNRVFAGETVAIDTHAVLLRRLDGDLDERFFSGSFLPVRDETGTVGGIFHPLTEVTATVRADAGLLESERRLKATQDNVGVGIHEMDAEGRYLAINGTFTRLSGYTIGDFAGRSFLHFIEDAEERERALARFEQLVRGELESYSEERRYTSKLGRTWWAEIQTTAVRDEAGHFLYAVRAVQDVTERKRAEEALRQLNETLERRVADALAERRMLAEIVESTDVIVTALDLRHNILAGNAAFNDEFERLYGVRPKLGDNVLELLAGRPVEREEVRAGWERALAGEEFTFVREFGNPALDRRGFEAKFRSLKNEAGERIGAYQFVTDVSERLRAEAELEAAQEQLRQSQKMEAMGQLTGGVAHDFNNLLTPIIGSLDLLVRKGLGNERERRLIDGALQSAERAKTLVQRLLAFARRQPLQPTAVDVARLVGGMTDLIGSTLGPTIDVRVDLAADLPPAKADPNQLEMALLNLAVNARDAMPDGGELTIIAKRESVRTRHPSGVKPGHYVRLSVGDTGVGMDEATRERAIEPFFSTKGIGKGTGLGLSMVHGLAAQLGGGLTMKSAPGQGTTVELWLPISATVVNGEDRPLDVPPAPEGLGTALLVDDEELVRVSTADMLADLGYDVVEADSAEDALRLVGEGFKPDLLVTDHLMPGMSGAELARELKSERPELPVLIVSGYADAEGVEPDLPRLTKPFRTAELAASLSALLPAAAG